MTRRKRIGLWLASVVMPVGAAVGQEEQDETTPPLFGPPLPEDRKTTPLVGQILNHAETGVTAIYDRASYDSEKRQALVLWGDRLDSILRGATAGGKLLRIG